MKQLKQLLCCRNTLAVNISSELCVFVCPLARLRENHPKLCSCVTHNRLCTKYCWTNCMVCYIIFKGHQASSCALPLHCTSRDTLGKRQSANTGATDRNGNKMVNFMSFWAPNILQLKMLMYEGNF